MPSIKELKELLKVLRANGVVSYETADVKLSLLETIPSKEAITPVAALKDDYEEPSEEDLLFYSSLAPKTDQA